MPINVDPSGAYCFTDATVKGGKFYSYKVVSVVDKKESYASAPLTVQTTVAIDTLNEELTAMELVQDTPLSEGQTVADLLAAQKQYISVTDSEGVEQTVLITWNADDVDIHTVGEYTAHAYIRGYSENPVDVTVISAVFTSFFTSNSFLIYGALTCFSKVQYSFVAAKNFLENICIVLSGIILLIKHLHRKITAIFNYFKFFCR